MSDPASDYIMETISADHLRRCAAVVDRLIELGMKMVSVSISNDSTILDHIGIQVRDKESFGVAAKAMKRGVKSVDSNYRLEGEIDGLRVKVFAGRDRVCKIVGYEEVVEPALPAMSAQPERVVRIPVWDCEPILKPGKEEG